MLKGEGESPKASTGGRRRGARANPQRRARLLEDGGLKPPGLQKTEESIAAANAGKSKHEQQLEQEAIKLKQHVAQQKKVVDVDEEPPSKDPKVKEINDRIFKLGGLVVAGSGVQLKRLDSQLQTALAAKQALKHPASRCTSAENHLQNQQDSQVEIQSETAATWAQLQDMHKALGVKQQERERRSRQSHEAKLVTALEKVKIEKAKLDHESSTTPAPAGWTMSNCQVPATAGSRPTQKASSSSECSQVSQEIVLEDTECSPSVLRVVKQEIVLEDTVIAIKDDDGMEQSTLSRILLSYPFELEAPTMQELHDSGECKPCSYIYANTDGCKFGSKCRFCHFCSPEVLSQARDDHKTLMKARLTQARKEFKAKNK